MKTVVFFRLMKSEITAYRLSKIKVAREAKSAFPKHFLVEEKNTSEITIT